MPCVYLKILRFYSNNLIGMKSLCITPKSKKLMKQLENLYVQMNKIYEQDL